MSNASNAKDNASKQLCDVLDDLKAEFQALGNRLQARSKEAGEISSFLFQAYQSHITGFIAALDQIKRYTDYGFLELKHIVKLIAEATLCYSNMAAFEQFSQLWWYITFSPPDFETRGFDCNRLLDHQSPSIIRNILEYFLFILWTAASALWDIPRQLHTFRIDLFGPALCKFRILSFRLAQFHFIGSG